ncbi:MAG: ArsR/SmtB family transcription factor [Anaerolineae bacterium]
MSEFTEQAILVFKALSDPTRYEMVRMLCQADELGCGDFAARFDLTPPALSHHYRVLERAGLVQSRKEGLHVWYHLDRSTLDRFMPDFERTHVVATTPV